MHKVPRQWLINVAYTVIGEPFSTWVKDEISSRNEELAKKKKLLIDMDPEIAKAFHDSVNISSRYNSCLLSSWSSIWLTLMLFSIEWKQCSLAQGWLEASQNTSWDEGATVNRRVVSGLGTWKGWQDQAVGGGAWAYEDLRTAQWRGS